jgi:hypothetical protein
MLDVDKPLAEHNDATEMPNEAAIFERVSPGLMT